MTLIANYAGFFSIANKILLELGYSHVSTDVITVHPCSWLQSVDRGLS